MNGKQIGRPTPFKNEFCDQAITLCKLGATDVELAEFFKVCVQTLHNWKNNHPEFFEALKKGKEIFDTERVEGALRHRALGYSHPEEKIFCNGDGEVTTVQTEKHFAPDVTACIFWLKNRQPTRWRDRAEISVEGADGAPLVPSRIELVAAVINTPLGGSTGKLGIDNG